MDGEGCSARPSREINNLRVKSKHQKLHIRNRAHQTLCIRNLRVTEIATRKLRSRHSSPRSNQILHALVVNSACYARASETNLLEFDTPSLTSWVGSGSRVMYQSTINLESDTPRLTRSGVGGTPGGWAGSIGRVLRRVGFRIIRVPVSDFPSWLPNSAVLVSDLSSCKNSHPVL